MQAGRFHCVKSFCKRAVASFCGAMLLVFVLAVAAVTCTAPIAEAGTGALAVLGIVGGGANRAAEGPAESSAEEGPDTADSPADAEAEGPHEGPTDDRSGTEDAALWRRVRAFKLTHWTPRDFRSLVLLAEKVESSAAGEGDTILEGVAEPGDVGRARPAGERALHMALDMRRRLLLVRGDEEQLARVERLAAAFDVPAAALPEGEIEGLLAVRLRHVRPLDVVNALRQLDLHDASMFVPEGKLLVVRVRHGARRQAADAIRALDAP